VQQIANMLRQTEKSQECLKNIMRTILYRRTHSSLLFASPVIKLPDIGARTVEATFCDVEQAIYCRIFTIFIDNINGEYGMVNNLNFINLLGLLTRYANRNARPSKACEVSMFPDDDSQTKDVLKSCTDNPRNA